MDENDGEVEPVALERLNNLVFNESPEVLPATSTGTSATVSGIEEQETEVTENALIDAYLSDPSPPTEIQAASPLLLQPDAFVDWFAAINVFKLLTKFNHHDPVEIVKFVPSGNSRATPKPFLYYCGLGQCGYKTWHPRDVENYQVCCDGALKEKNLVCPHDDCGRSFSTEASLKTHQNHYHAFEPRICPRCPEQTNVIFQDYSTWNKHQKDVHYLFNPPIHCPLKDQSCTQTEKLYTSRSVLYHHLRMVHKHPSPPDLVPAFKKMRTGVKKPVQRFECPLDDCTSGSHASPKLLRNHLQRKHAFSDAEAWNLVPATKGEKVSQAVRAAKGPEPAKIPWKCPVASCTSKGRFKDKNSRREHLQNVHKWKHEKAIEHVPLTAREIELKAKARAGTESSEEEEGQKAIF